MHATMNRVTAATLWLGLVVALVPTACLAQSSVARQWIELALDAIRIDKPRPTVHARNLFHLSCALYDGWSSYDATSLGYFEQQKLTTEILVGARDKTMSFAAYRVLSSRYGDSPGADTSLAAFDGKMDKLGYDRNFTSTAGNFPAAVGNRIAETILQFGNQDGANEALNYADTTGYVSTNPSLDPDVRGTTLVDANRWQPLVVEGETQEFLTPHWGNVTGFGLPPYAQTGLRMDAGPVPLLNGPSDNYFKESVLEVIQFSTLLDPNDGVMLDISPGVRGNHTLGTSEGSGHSVNPATGEPYPSRLVRQADYGRVLAEFWADGPNSETPAGHWNTILNQVSDHPLLEKRIAGVGPEVSDLEWDTKAYFALNAALHNAAIISWDNKEVYDYVRPITMIRHMSGLGQSSDESAPSYAPNGLPLEPGLVELITTASTAIGERHEHLDGHEGEIAVRSWQGYPDTPEGVGGVGWILGEDWRPYQATDFVTPPFAAFSSGHSTFSRAAAEVLTAITGDTYFPGGLGTFRYPANTLKFESGPTEDVVLEWATYYDAADEAGISRLYGGIHVAVDDFRGRVTGAEIGINAFTRAHDYFLGARKPHGWLHLGGEIVGEAKGATSHVTHTPVSP